MEGSSEEVVGCKTKCEERPDKNSTLIRFGKSLYKANFRFSKAEHSFSEPKLSAVSQTL